MDLIYSGAIRQGEVDDMCCNSSSRKLFEVNSFYKVFHPGFAQVFPWKTVWKPKVPYKVSFFL